MGGLPWQHGQLQERRSALIRVAWPPLLLEIACATPLLLALACAAPPAAEVGVLVKVGRPAMGTLLEITLEAPDAVAAQSALDAAFARIDALEAAFTTYDAASPVSRLNAAAGSGPQPVPLELVRILADAKRFHRATGGVFDVTVGPLIRLWDEAAERERLPDPAALAIARGGVGSDQISLSEASAELVAGASINLGGIGKGWALDQLGELLAARGIQRAFLDFGGSSLLAIGAPPRLEGWRAAVQDGRGGYLGVLTLRDAAASVSESFGESWEIDGRRYGHVIDPRSGWPISAPRAAVVLAADASSAEAWSTALLVLPAEAGIERIAARVGLEALVLDETGARHQTPGFAAAAALRPIRSGDPGLEIDAAEPG
jgi:thiamine biosynthesis lipoprotein